jgi:hypothetical protein
VVFQSYKTVKIPWNRSVFGRATVFWLLPCHAPAKNALRTIVLGTVPPKTAVFSPILYCTVLPLRPAKSEGVYVEKFASKIADVFLFFSSFSIPQLSRVRNLVQFSVKSKPQGAKSW